MVPLNIITVIHSSVGDPNLLCETSFTKSIDSVAVPRVNESILLNNYILEVVDIMHSALSPVKVFCRLALESVDLLTQDQLDVLTKTLTYQGWTVDDSHVRQKDDEEMMTFRELH